MVGAVARLRAVAYTGSVCSRTMICHGGNNYVLLELLFLGIEGLVGWLQLDQHYHW